MNVDSISFTAPPSTGIAGHPNITFWRLFREVPESHESRRVYPIKLWIINVIFLSTGRVEFTSWIIPLCTFKTLSRALKTDLRRVRFRRRVVWPQGVHNTHCIIVITSRPSASKSHSQECHTRFVAASTHATFAGRSVRSETSAVQVPACRPRVRRSLLLFTDRFHRFFGSSRTRDVKQNMCHISKYRACYSFVDIAVCVCVRVILYGWRFFLLTFYFSIGDLRNRVRTFVVGEWRKRTHKRIIYIKLYKKEKEKWTRMRSRARTAWR